MKQGYSQNFEEHHILQYFGDFKGTFCDIGANDSVTLSNTRRLTELGWSGFLIEPSPRAFERLATNIKAYPKVQGYQLATTDKDGELELMESGELLGTGDVALVSSFLPEEVKRFEAIPHTPVMVRTMAWDSFYSMIGRPKIDFVSCDAEGFDVNILKQMNLEEIGVRCLCIEWNSVPSVKAEIESLMKGYKIIYTSAENLIFAK